MPRRRARAGTSGGAKPGAHVAAGWYRRVLARCTPTARAYREYREDVACYVDATEGRGRPLFMHGDAGAVSKLELRRSVIFEREYLIAWVRPDWLARVAPSCDAIAANVERLGGFEPPPMVIAPDTRRRSRSHELTSIVEHEFVHINQALCGHVRSSATPSSVEEVLDDFFAYTRMEIEAEVVQRSRWPSAMMKRLGLTLPQWCLLRGYTQALEHVLREIAYGRLSEALAAPFFEKVLEQARQRLRDRDLGDRELDWFESRWGRDVLTAMAVESAEDAEPEEARAAVALGRPSR